MSCCACTNAAQQSLAPTSATLHVAMQGGQNVLHDATVNAK
jgi:hypothetical protein